mgnify:CR=1 FL=1
MGIPCPVCPLIGFTLAALLCSPAIYILVRNTISRSAHRDVGRPGAAGAGNGELTSNDVHAALAAWYMCPAGAGDSTPEIPSKSIVLRLYDHASVDTTRHSTHLFYISLGL